MEKTSKLKLEIVLVVGIILIAVAVWFAFIESPDRDKSLLSYVIHHQKVTLCPDSTDYGGLHERGDDVSPPMFLEVKDVYFGIAVKKIDCSEAYTGI
jgi:hypothetical protein